MATSLSRVGPRQRWTGRSDIAFPHQGRDRVSHRFGRNGILRHIDRKIPILIVPRAGHRLCTIAAVCRRRVGHRPERPCVVTAALIGHATAAANRRCRAFAAEHRAAAIGHITTGLSGTRIRIGRAGPYCAAGRRAVRALVADLSRTAGLRGRAASGAGRAVAYVSALAGDTSAARLAGLSARAGISCQIESVELR